MPPPERVDLHLHSTASDGTWAPTELVRRAAQGGVTTVALTDHDSTAGVGEAVTAAQRFGVTVLPAVEITASASGWECHLLGYFVDVNAAELQSLLTERRAARRRRFLEMLSRLRARGGDLSLTGVEPADAETALGRPHLAAALVAQGMVATPEAAFRQYLGRHAPAYVPHEPFPPAEGLRILRAAGAVPVLAHPVLHGAERLLPHLVEQGLLGLECYHPQHSPPVVDYFLRQARRYGLVVTGGSDSHGPEQPGLGTVDVPPEVVWSLQQARERV